MAERPPPPAPSASTEHPNSAEHEQAQFKEVLEHKPHGLDLNEAGRTTESDTRGNPPGSVHGLPQPAVRETQR